MIHLQNRPQISRFTGLVLYLTVVLLLLIHFSEGRSRLVGPHQPIVAILGDDIVLPCQVEPAEDAVSKMVQWARLDLKPTFVHVRRDSELLPGQNPSYKGRTSLSVNKLQHGDLSLTLSRVKISDEGTYRCLISSEDTQLDVELIVGSVSSPIVKISKVSSGLLLECESEGWNPEPEVLWLDSEGHVLSAGRPETVRGPDGLYTVSSRVTVEKRHNNSFTCRVQQKNINQTRETQIHLPDDLFQTQSVYVYVIIGLVVCVIVILAVVFIVWKRRRNQRKSEWNKVCKSEMDITSSSGAQQRAKETVMILDKKMGKLDEELVKGEVEFKDVEEAVSTLTEYKRDLKDFIEEFEQFSEWIDKQVDNKERQVSSWMLFRRNVKGHHQDNITDLGKRKKANETLLQKSKKLYKKTENEIRQIQERKRKLDRDQEKISRDREATKRNRDKIQEKLISEK